MLEEVLIRLSWHKEDVMVCLEPLKRKEASALDRPNFCITSSGAGAVVCSKSGRK